MQVLSKGDRQPCSQHTGFGDAGEVSRQDVSVAEMFQQDKLQEGVVVHHFFLTVWSFSNTALCQPAEGQGEGLTPACEFESHPVPAIPNISLI